MGIPLHRPFAMKRTTIHLSDRTLAALQGRATTEGRTPSDLARHLLTQALGLHEAPKLPLKKNPKLKGL